MEEWKNGMDAQGRGVQLILSWLRQEQTTTQKKEWTIYLFNLNFCISRQSHNRPNPAAMSGPGDEAGATALLHTQALVSGSGGDLGAPPSGIVLPTKQVRVVCVVPCVPCVPCVRLADQTTQTETTEEKAGQASVQQLPQVPFRYATRHAPPHTHTACVLRVGVGRVRRFAAVFAVHRQRAGVVVRRRAPQEARHATKDARRPLRAGRRRPAGHARDGLPGPNLPGLVRADTTHDTTHDTHRTH